MRIRERSRLTTLDAVLPPDPSSPDPLQLAEAGELAERMRTALSEIDPRQWNVLFVAA